MSALWSAWEQFFLNLQTQICRLLHYKPSRTAEKSFRVCCIYMWYKQGLFDLCSPLCSGGALGWVQAGMWAPRRSEDSVFLVAFISECIWQSCIGFKVRICHSMRCPPLTVEIDAYVKNQTGFGAQCAALKPSVLGCISTWPLKYWQADPFLFFIYL